MLGGRRLARRDKPSLRCIIYRNASSSNGMIRNYVRGSSSNVTARGTVRVPQSRILDAGRISRTIFPSSHRWPVRILISSRQSFETATARQRQQLCPVLRPGEQRPAGLHFVPASKAGWDVLKWLDTTLISNATLLGALPLLGVTDVVLSIGKRQSRRPERAGGTIPDFALETGHALFACPAERVDRVRPDVYTNKRRLGARTWAVSPTPIIGAAVDAEQFAFLNLYKAAGAWGQNNALRPLRRRRQSTPNEPGGLFPPNAPGIARHR